MVHISYWNWFIALIYKQESSQIEKDFLVYIFIPLGQKLQDRKRSTLRGS